MMNQIEIVCGVCHDPFIVIDPRPSLLDDPTCPSCNGSALVSSIAAIDLGEVLGKPDREKRKRRRACSGYTVDGPQGIVPKETR